mgnify:CR=1 FL=1
MTVTVDLKELRDFEANVHHWGCRRGLAAVEAVYKLYESDNFYRGSGSQNVGLLVKKTLDEWDEKNPAPKLIPDV